MAFDQLSLEAYADMLLAFKKSGYKTVKFQDVVAGDLEQIVVYRHDVDVSVAGAVAMAEVEHECAVVSTFFFLLTSPLYNMLSKEVGEQVRRIFDLGHDIALHFNPYYYGTGALDYIEQELNILSTFYPFANLDWISFHRPGEFASQLGHIKLPNGVRHTYEPVFFEALAYYSDSRGAWSYGHPLESKEYAMKQGMQVLTHPIWWFESQVTADDTLTHHAERTRAEYLQQIRAEVFPDSDPEFL